MLVIGWKNSVRFCRGLADRGERLLFEMETGIIKVNRDAKIAPEADAFWGEFMTNTMFGWLETRVLSRFLNCDRKRHVRQSLCRNRQYL